MHLSLDPIQLHYFVCFFRNRDSCGRSYDRLQWGGRHIHEVAQLTPTFQSLLIVYKGKTPYILALSFLPSRRPPTPSRRAIIPHTPPRHALLHATTLKTRLIEIDAMYRQTTKLSALQPRGGYSNGWTINWSSRASATTWETNTAVSVVRTHSLRSRFMPHARADVWVRHLHATSMPQHRTDSASNQGS